MLEFLRSRLRGAANLSTAAVVGVLAGGGGYAIGAGSSGPTIHGCVNRNHVLLIQARCGRGQRRLLFGQRGPQGAAGAAGASGAPGPAGAPGKDAVSYWEVVDASGKYVAGSDLGITTAGTGQYFVNKINGLTDCGFQVTPTFGGNGATAPPISVSVIESPMHQGVFLTSPTTGAAVDNGFVVSVQC